MYILHALRNILIFSIRTSTLAYIILGALLLVILMRKLVSPITTLYYHPQEDIVFAKFPVIYSSQQLRFWRRSFIMEPIDLTFGRQVTWFNMPKYLFDFFFLIMVL